MKERYTERMKKGFKERVYAIVSHIPYGETMSYGEVAKKAGSPRAARAVGTFMAENYDLTIPCHRVVRKDGSVGEYNRGGPNRKKALLREEGALV